MSKISAADAKQKFGQVLDMAQRSPVQITKHGRSVAYVISKEDYEEEQRQKEHHLQTMLQEGLADLEAGRTVGIEDVRAELARRRS